MEWNAAFFIKGAMLGIGLAMDAFSVALANGLNNPKMGRGTMCGIAGTFSFFQALMPMIGWICVHSLVRYFNAFERFIPWIALFLLSYIGFKMLIEGIRNEGGSAKKSEMGFSALVLQGIATSIDALSVGFTIAEYGLLMACVCTLIIAAETFAICMAGIIIGKKFGTKFSNKATIFGGLILIIIGIEIFITSLM